MSPWAGMKKTGGSDLQWTSALTWRSPQKISPAGARHLHGGWAQRSGMIVDVTPYRPAAATSRAARFPSHQIRVAKRTSSRNGSCRSVTTERE